MFGDRSSAMVGRRRYLTGGWKKARILWMWIAIALISGLASLAGYGLFQNSSSDTVAFVLACAAGAILREADDGARTHDPQLGKLMLYQLSYVRVGPRIVEKRR